MEIVKLFNAYETYLRSIKDVDLLFENSKMTNEYGKLDYGFFPLGSGILKGGKSSIDIAEINNCKVLVLGNDWGAKDYFEECIHNNKSERETNPTIRNLLCGLDLNPDTTFFTNLFLGIRNEGKNIDPKSVDNDFRKFCFDFLFDTQIKLLNPEIILCLGQEVCYTLVQYITELASFGKETIVKLYNSNTRDYVGFYNNIKFIVIPHPSFAHLNWAKYNIKQKIQNEIRK